MNDAPRRTSARTRTLIAALACVSALGVWTWFNRAPQPDAETMAQIRAGNLGQAEQTVRDRIAKVGENPTDIFTLARVLRKQGDVRGSQEQLVRAVQLGGDEEIARTETTLAQAQMGQVDQVQQHLDEMLSTGTIDGREVLEASINGLLINGRIESAEELIGVWLHNYPKDPRAHYFQARQQMYYGKAEAVAKSCLDSLQIEPDSGPTAYLLGKAYSQLNQPEDALEQFTKASNHLIHDSAASLEKAKVLRVLGRPSDAREVLNRIVKLSKADVKTGFLRVGDKYEGDPIALELGGLELADDNVDEAVSWLEVAVKASPRDLAARQALGLAYRSAGQNEKAKHELQFVRDTRAALREVDHLVDRIEQNPALIEERIDVADLYFKHASDVTAEFWLKTALARDADNVRAHRLLAEVYEQRAKSDARFSRAAEQHRRTADRLAAADTAN